MNARARPAAAPVAPRARAGPGLFTLVALLAVAFAVARAVRLAWVTDDAYISFRYADHLVRGLGLVFNAGERVEGYSNFLWTLWCALGLRAGFEPETWANASSLAAHAGIVLGLGGWAWSRRAEPGALSIPLAALLYALHRDAAVFATGGLETAWFTAFACAGFLPLTGPRPGAGRCALAAGSLAAAALTRMDGLVFVAVGIAAVPFVARSRGRALAAFVGVAAAILLPYLAWKWRYYGDLLPNTYYAKSAMDSWWTQGGLYLGLYLLRYPAIGIGILVSLAALVAAILAGRRPQARPSPAGASAPALEDPDARAVRTLALLLVPALAYTLAVARVGGDFMFGRFLVPVTPLFLASLEVAIGRLGRGRAAWRWTLATLACAGVLAGADPVAKRGIVSGIVHEEAANPDERRDSMRRLGAVLRRYGEGLPLRVAFGGSQAILAYTSRIPYAVETSTGLTDPLLARMPIERRGRVGHEKRAPYEFLIGTRRVHFMPGRGEPLDRTLHVAIPLVHMELEGYPCTLLTWESSVMDSLRSRGAVVEDFPEQLARFVRALPTLPDSVVREGYAKLRRFYFVYEQDRPAEEAIRARLERSNP